jgi:hypothetical protein
MFFSPPNSRPDDPPSIPAIVRSMAMPHLTWNDRPVFKAPPLQVEPPMADVASFIAGLSKAGRAERLSSALAPRPS